MRRNTATTTNSIVERVERFVRYYRFENDRPLLGFFVGSEYPLKRYSASFALPENRPLRPDDFNPADYSADYDRLFEQHEAAGGDFIFAGEAFWGIPWLEALLGCELWANHASGSIHAKPLQIVNAMEKIPLFTPSSPWAQKAAEFLDMLAARSGGRYPLAATRMRGITDLLAAVYGNEMFLYKMLEAPREVQMVCSKLTDLWIDFARFQLDHIPSFYGGVGSFYYNMWAPAGSVWLQEDAAALLSPALYEEFILPCDVRIARSFGGCLMHMHPTGFYPYRQLLDTPMSCLELHIDHGGPTAEQLYGVHCHILAKKPLLIWGQLSLADLDWIFTRLPHRGLAVMTVVSSPQEAQTIWNRYIGK